MGDVLSQIKHLLDLIIQIKEIIIGDADTPITDLDVNGGTIIVTTIRLKRSSHVKGQLIGNSKRVARVGRNNISCHSKEIPQS